MTEEECYIAPVHPRGSLEDPVLLALIESRRPRFVMINLRGGVQERLRFYLRNNLSAFGASSFSLRPALICTGAPIALLAGIQANIPVWADRFMLGWLMRTLKDPRRLVPRYVRA